MAPDTTGFPGEIICVQHAPLEEASASSNLHLGEGEFARAPLRLVATEWRDDSAVYYDVLEALTHSVANAARHKNVPVQTQYYADVAREAIRLMTSDEMAGLLALDPVAVKKAQVALSQALDVVAATMVANFVAYIRGIENPAGWFVAPIVEAHLEAIKIEGSMIVWPDLLETALKYAQAPERADG